VDIIHKYSGFSPTVLDSFAAPGGANSDVWGLTYARGDLIAASEQVDKIFVMSGISGTVKNSFAAPDTTISGLAWDTDDLYSTENSAPELCYQHSGISATVKATWSSNDPFGIAYWGKSLSSSSSCSSVSSSSSSSSTSSSCSSVSSSSSESTYPLLATSSSNFDVIYFYSQIDHTEKDSIPSVQSPNGLTFIGRDLISGCYEVAGSKTFRHVKRTATIKDSFTRDADALTTDQTDLIGTTVVGVATVIYIYSGFSATQKDSFAAPDQKTRGLAYDGTDLISGSCNIINKIFVHSGITVTTTDSFAIPASDLSGLTFDGTDLYSSDHVTNLCYQHSGISVTVKATWASNDATGMAYWG